MWCTLMYTEGDAVHTEGDVVHTDVHTSRKIAAAVSLNLLTRRLVRPMVSVADCSLAFAYLNQPQSQPHSNRLPHRCFSISASFFRYSSANCRLVSLSSSSSCSEACRATQSVSPMTICTVLREGHLCNPLPRCCEQPI